jgi:hypothetical protein
MANYLYSQGSKDSRLTPTLKLEETDWGAQSDPYQGRTGPQFGDRVASRARQGATFKPWRIQRIVQLFVH